MQAPLRCSFFVVCPLPACLWPTSAPDDDELSKREVAALGKAATALVEVDGKTATGSAFCINAAGLFLTAEHVVRSQGSKGKVVLVMNPGRNDQKSYAAQVVRSEAELDLALLRTEKAEKLPALTLGSDEKLQELAELVAFGFPFGKSLALERGAYPAVSVNAGMVTSLRNKDGKLSRIQIDAGVNPGNSGGPVLDMRGRIVGMVESGLLGTTVNYAIPVSHIDRFLAMPDLQFTPPSLGRASMHQPTLVQVKAVSLLPEAKSMNLELIVKTDDGRERRFPMAAADGGHRATIVPVPATEGPAQLRLSANYTNGSLSGTAMDKPFKVGSKEVRLRDVRSVQFRPKPQVVQADGKPLEGAITGQDTVAVQLGEE
jgi:S1-C subfamily serine protease